jgi:hypothetical protein
VKVIHPQEFNGMSLRDCPVPGDMLVCEMPQPAVRTLKIEADGDLWKGLLKPKIRLMGRWLERAGFKPGHRVHVTCAALGVIELRSPVEHIAREHEPTKR